jgi:hypothetical protein
VVIPYFGITKQHDLCANAHKDISPNQSRRLYRAYQSRACA